MLKIVAVAAMSTLAIVNRYLLVPRLPNHRLSMTRALKLLALVEVGLGLSAITLVASFGTQDPV